jgi:hypothetical protein
MSAESLNPQLGLRLVSTQCGYDMHMKKGEPLFAFCSKIRGGDVAGILPQAIPPSPILRDFQEGKIAGLLLKHSL